MHTGWLSPEGKFYPCACYDHISTAREIIDELKIQDDSNNAVPDDILIKHGFVGISIMTLTDHGFVFYYKKLTPEQARFLKPYIEDEYELPVIQISKDDYEWATMNL